MLASTGNRSKNEEKLISSLKLTVLLMIKTQGTISKLNARNHKCLFFSLLTNDQVAMEMRIFSELVCIMKNSSYLFIRYSSGAY